MHDLNSQRELPADLVIFDSKGKVQFGWQDPETGNYHAEAGGEVISNAVGAVAWQPGRMH
ncbi:hypothetical protein QYH69_22350 [Paraburkholderia sp. SARCC-3016]|uniref:hypothetical protein n=1 Tax=Paraburkholderia sp. SARCC-3016 TaxID=3058611 RepID=UPI002806F55F|nr:hypothetical protein [Paraburkholderia sp. SARCC-3016]MDQ7979987.1 hypothetical protein [Paraburkholderia sp. SARCC-3016]